MNNEDTQPIDLSEVNDFLADELPKLVRHKTRGAFKLRRDCWGTRYEACRDPEGVDKVDTRFRLLTDFDKLPADQWARIIELYWELCDPNNTVVDFRSEVSVVFARGGEDFKEWRTFVPKQTVGAASVDADLQDLVDIVTGERCPGFPDGWVHAGSSHSHQTMGAYFSATDDRYELDVPGMHIVVGQIDDKAKTYRPKASIVSAHVRHDVKFRLVVAQVTETQLPHPEARKQITKVDHMKAYRKHGRSYHDDGDSEWGFGCHQGILSYSAPEPCRGCRELHYHKKTCLVGDGNVTYDQRDPAPECRFCGAQKGGNHVPECHYRGAVILSECGERQPMRAIHCKGCSAALRSIHAKGCTWTGLVIVSECELEGKAEQSESDHQTKPDLMLDLARLSGETLDDGQLRIAILAARRRALSLTQQARESVNRLCDALASGDLTPTARGLVADLILDDLREVAEEAQLSDAEVLGGEG